ncbi:ribbon-helix-helix protein, CopG family [Arthrobacter castelli]|uniref:type II toxin-antitoxin system VapB family antitoxin n=1 Tax=Arthrobacter castelli TaxID=271431 RepID=UPI000428F43F|nr:ribbon-helix-helix protein, CopG family [Arthrobacter castelli]
MTDVLIRNVSDDDLARVDKHAAKLGLSRGEYLRRRIAQDAGRTSEAATMADLERFASLSQDLRDDDVMRDAWT